MPKSGPFKNEGIHEVAHNTTPSKWPIGDPQSLEQAFNSYFDTLPTNRKAKAAEAVRNLINAPEAERIQAYGTLSNIDLAVPTAVAAQAAAVPIPGKNGIDLQQLRNDLEFHALLNGTPGEPQGFHTQHSGCTLSFSVNNMHCDTVTGLLGLQDDEIYLGGVAIDTLGNVAAIVPFDVGSFGHGQDRSVHNPFASFEIENLNNWPKAYSVTFVLAEKHSGGIYDFIYKLAEQAKTEIVGYVTTAVTTATGALIGGVIGAPFAGIGALIGAAVGAVVGWLVGTIWAWMKTNLFGDDIFTPATSNLTIAAPGDTWVGGSSLPTIWDLKGFDGEYHVAGQWTVTWEPSVNTGWHLAFDGNWKVLPVVFGGT